MPMTKNQTVAIIQRLHGDKKHAANFVRDPAAEWQALGGQLPAGVTAAQFSQRMRGSPFFKEVQATANGKMSAMAWTPCITSVVVLFHLLGIGVVGVVSAVSAPAEIAIAAFFGAEVTAIRAFLATSGETTVFLLATALCAHFGML